MDKAKKKILIVAALAVLLAAGVVLVYTLNKKTPEGKLDGNIQTAEKKQPTDTLNVHLRVAEPKNDQDSDGLSDEEEKKLGLNIKDIDTDGDGLQDAPELNIFKTDPKKFDTDGDGYGDGVEIVSGYNPLGAGKTE